MGGADGGPAWWMTTVEQLEPDSEVFITLTAPSSTAYCCHNLHLFDLTRQPHLCCLFNTRTLGWSRAEGELTEESMRRRAETTTRTLPTSTPGKFALTEHSGPVQGRLCRGLGVQLSAHWWRVQRPKSSEYLDGP